MDVEGRQERYFSPMVRVQSRATLRVALFGLLVKFPDIHSSLCASGGSAPELEQLINAVHVQYISSP